MCFFLVFKIYILYMIFVVFLFVLNYFEIDVEFIFGGM